MEPEFEIARALIAAQIEAGLTQEEVAKPYQREFMKGQCQQCGRQELVTGSVRVFYHTVAELGWPVQLEQSYFCANCGREIHKKVSYRFGRPSRMSGTRESGGASQPQTESMLAMISMGNKTSVHFAAVCRTDTREVLPRWEGIIQDGTTVDQYGNPGLMADFAKQYLAAYRAVMPSGRASSIRWRR